MNYKHLHYFWKVAQAGSITRASKQLRLAPQTLSSQIQQLESDLGVALFDRTGRRLELTKAGHLALDYADEIFMLGTELSSAMSGAQTERPLAFRVGVADVLPKRMTLRILEPVLKSGLDVHLICIEDKLDQLLANLALHKLDLVLADTPPIPGIHIQVRHNSLGTNGISFFAVADLLKQYPHPFPEVLSHAPVLLPTHGNALRSGLDQWFSELGINPKVAAECQDSALLKDFGQAGIGLFCGPSLLESEICWQYGVKTVGRTEKVAAEYFAITAERRQNHPAVDLILQHAMIEGQ
uniref:DNA-binding transcriptional activator, LysR family n=1 Tax=Magnetococcus massalia (strain MO-1) TaxID=451514 RepID=A0A1S7LKU7_MAGMO|nr:DNA-binding transcriptional activator, LysR family [Candidatus Magnetococcus massalia]